MADPARSGWYACIVVEEGVAGEQHSDSLVVEPAPRDESPVTQRGSRGDGAPAVRRETQNEDGCEAVLVVLDARPALAAPVELCFVVGPRRADGWVANALGGRTAGATRS